jgi:hypothetical protein
MSEILLIVIFDIICSSKIPSNDVHYNVHSSKTQIWQTTKYHSLIEQPLFLLD